jgi:poly-D-alanine transfer protein DltD
MELDSAISLADFINNRGNRFIAKVLHYGNRGWVLVLDKHTDEHLEPIADPHDYLRRARLGILKIEDAYHDLVAEWITEG